MLALLVLLCLAGYSPARRPDELAKQIGACCGPCVNGLAFAIYNGVVLVTEVRAGLQQRSVCGAGQHALHHSTVHTLLQQTALREASQASTDLSLGLQVAPASLDHCDCSPGLVHTSKAKHQSSGAG